MNFVQNQKSFQDMMTIQQATGKAITKVETGDYDMMDEVGFCHRCQGVCHMTDVDTRNIIAATEGYPEEEISRRQAGAAQAPRKCASIVNVFTTHNNTILYLSSPQPFWTRAIRMFDVIQRVPILSYDTIIL